MSLIGNGIFVCRGELSTLITAMKRNSRWNSYQDDESDILFKSLFDLKQTLNKIEDLRLIDPILFLGPFLEVIRAEETTGAVTSLALASLNKFLSYGIIDPTHPALAGTVESIADAVTHARFMGTDQASDALTLMRVVEVLHTLMRCPEGSALTNESVCEVMLSCFKICFEPRLNELLRRTAEQALKDMVLLLFMRLPQFSEDGSASVLYKKLKMVAGPMEQHSGKRRKSKIKKQSVNDEIPQIQHSNTIKTGEHSPITPTAKSLSSQDHVPSTLIIQKGPPLGTTPATPVGNILDMQGKITQTPTTALENLEEQNLSVNNGLQRKEIIAISNMVKSIEVDLEQGPDKLDEEDEVTCEYVNSVGVRFKHDGSSTTGANSILMPYGLPCIQEIFRFLILLCNPLDKQNTDAMMHMGLSLLTVVLEVAADNIGKYEILLSLVKDDLCRNLFSLLKAERLTIFSADLQLCFLLFESLRSHLKYQLELYLQKLMEIIVNENPRIPYEMKELSLDNLLQLWKIPGFVAELYINYDCDLYCSDVFENLTKLLSKNVLSATTAVYSTHTLSLEALMSVIENIEKNCAALKSGFGIPSSNRHSRQSSELEGVIIGDDSNESIAVENINNFIKHLERRFTLPLATLKVDELHCIKTKKRILSQGTELFNLRPEKGIQFLQENNLLSQQLNPIEIAEFLRTNSSLDKKAIGEYISKKKNVESKILENYVSSFDFKNMRIDEALRLYLETFRLPGEAPLIFLVMEHFSEHWSKQNNDPFANTDAAFRLAYAIIMLNMDQHNHNAKRLNIPMTADDFCKNLRGLNGNGDFDHEMLINVFHAIKNEEIVMPAEQTGTVKENYLWKMLLRRSGKYFHVQDAMYDKEIFTILWGQALAALSFMFDKSIENGYEKILSGFTKCACVSSFYSLHDDFGGLILTLCKFTTLLNVQPDANEVILAVQFSDNLKAQSAVKCIFSLIHDFADCLREEGWKNVLELIVQLFRLRFLPKCVMEIEDFCEPNGKTILILEKPMQKPVESGLFSSLYSYLSSDGQREPTYEEQEIMKIGKKSIRECQIDQIIQESKFIQFESLQEFVKCLLALMKPPNAHKTVGIPYAEDVVTFWMEFLIKIVIQNRDRILPLWISVKNQIYLLLIGSSCCGYDYLLKRTTIALLKLGIYLMRNEELCPIVLQSLKMLICLKPTVINKISKQISIGIFELLKTSAQNIHTEQDWQIIFTSLEVVGAGLMPLESEDSALINSGTKSDGALSSEDDSGLPPDRGYISDSEIINLKSSGNSMVGTPQQHNTGTNAENWILVNKVSEELSITSRSQSPLPLTNSLIYPCNLIEQPNPFALFKCWDSLAFIVRNVAHITPYNFESCVRCIRTFVEACIDGGIKMHKKHSGGKSKKTGNGGVKKEIRKKRLNDENSSASDDEDLNQRFETLSIQLLDLMYTLYTRTAQIFRWWAEEASDALPQCSALWAQGWCPLLQGIARFAMDRRREVRTYAISCLQQRALLVHDLQTLTGAEWASCFKQVLFPLLNELFPEGSSNKIDHILLEESRIRTATIMSKVFLHHLTPLIELQNFNDLWLEILDYIEKFIKVGSDTLYEQMLEILKNMLLVMHSVKVFQFNDGNGHSYLWDLTWNRISEFLPNLRNELFGDNESRQQSNSQDQLITKVPSVSILSTSAMTLNSELLVDKNVEATKNNSIILQPPNDDILKKSSGQPVIVGQDSEIMKQSVPILIPNVVLNSPYDQPNFTNLTIGKIKSNEVQSDSPSNLPDLITETAISNYRLHSSQNIVLPETVGEPLEISPQLPGQFSMSFPETSIAQQVSIAQQFDEENPNDGYLGPSNDCHANTSIADPTLCVPFSHLNADNQYPSFTKTPPNNIVQSFTSVYIQQPAQQGPVDIYTDYLKNPYNLALQSQLTEDQQEQQHSIDMREEIEKQSPKSPALSSYFSDTSVGPEIFGQP